jgi:hypothetical protein
MENVLVSEEDKHILETYKWYIDKGGYIASTIKRKNWVLHRYIFMEVLKHDLDRHNFVDHINGNKLDNRRENLRIVTVSENNRNRRKTGGATSIYYGVSKKTDEFYTTELRMMDLKLYASYKAEIYAAWQYNLWIDEHKIEHANKNDIEEPEDFILYTKGDKTLPKGISFRNNSYRLVYKKFHYGTYKTLDAANEKLAQVKKEDEEKRIEEIKADPIKRNEKNLPIIIYKGKEIIVDEEDYYNLLINGKLRISEGYARYRTNGKDYKLHRYLLNYDGKDFIDHINSNPLDNRKSNLRIATPKQNAQNRVSKKKNASSQYLGVYPVERKSGNKWGARIKVDGKINYLGYFAIEKEAALARDKATFKYFGESGKFNFPIKKENDDLENHKHLLKIVFIEMLTRFSH